MTKFFLNERVHHKNNIQNNEQISHGPVQPAKKRSDLYHKPMF